MSPALSRPESMSPAAGVSRASFAWLAAVQMSLIAAISLVSMALPEMQRAFGLELRDLAWFASAYGLAFSGLLIVGGRFADAAGPARAFRIGAAIFAAASALAAAAPAFGLLVAARMAQGAGAAFAAPAALALAATLYEDEERRARALATWGGLSGAGAVVGLLLSGVIASFMHWRWVFAPAGAVVLAALAALRRLDPGAPPERDQRLNGAGTLLLAGGIAAVTHGLLAFSGGAAPVRGLIFTALGSALLVAFRAVDARSTSPLVPRSLLGPGARRLALAAIVAASGASAATNVFLTLYFQQIRGYSPLETSLFFTPFLLTLAASAASGRLVRRLGPARVAAAGSVCIALSLWLLARLVSGSGGHEALLGLVLFPAGLGFAFSGATVLTLIDVPKELRGLGGGLVNTAMEAGPVIGLAALVMVAELRTAALLGSGLGRAEAAGGGYGAALLVCGALFVALGFSFVLNPTKRR